MVPVWVGHPANVSGTHPGVDPLRLAGYSQILAEAFEGL